MKLWAIWREFWDTFVPAATKGEPFAIVINGDLIDGVHHRSTTQITQNLADQGRIAAEVIAPLAELCDGRLYIVRGTEAHAGQECAEEERIARVVGAVPNETGQHARYDLWLRVGGRLCHFLHHIGTTGSFAYQSSALTAELTACYVQSARWSSEPPDCVVRSHRHTYCEVRVPSRNGFATVATTPCWQAKTPFAWRIPGARNSVPEWGGLVIRRGTDRLYVDPFVRTVDRSKEVTI
jgi:hypothetical protein